MNFYSQAILIFFSAQIFFCCSRSSVTPKFSPPEIPSSVEFAGEKVPLDDIEVRERLERELLINQNYHSSTMLIYKQMGRYRAYIEKTLKENGVPEDFFFLAVAESSLNPQATSPASAAGIWQFIPQTAESYGLEISTYVDERRHLEKSTIAACKYLKEAKKEFGTWTMAAAAYNRGFKGLKDAVVAQRETNYYRLYLNPETYRYVFRIIALKLILNNPGKYNFDLRSSDLYEPYKLKKVEIKESIDSLPEFAQKNGTTYKELILHNPWIRTGKYNFEVPSGKTYEFLIPDK
ncbi:MAG: lytic transglycosylase domain-containing protein [Leptospiraceae bacterium]|nr:lytic transglycosylase domain-containing protein [Leptospiraceae bacterium]